MNRLSAIEVQGAPFEFFPGATSLHCFGSMMIMVGVADRVRNRIVDHHQSSSTSSAISCSSLLIVMTPAHLVNVVHH
jgi:hypothetical protein